MPIFNPGDRILHTVLGYTATVLAYTSIRQCLVCRDDGEGYHREGYTCLTWIGNPSLMVLLTAKRAVDTELDKRFNNGSGNWDNV